VLKNNMNVIVRLPNGDNLRGVYKQLYDFESRNGRNKFSIIHIPRGINGGVYKYIKVNKHYVMISP
jgi:hypothetical protein